MRSLIRAGICLVILVFCWCTAAHAQAARDARVQITVVDPSSAIVPGATVTLVPLDPQAQAKPPAPATSDDKGLAVLTGVPPGRYSIRAEFPGFDLGLVQDVRIRGGDNKHVVILPIAKLEQSVTVGRDSQEVAADRKTSEFGTALAQEQLEALSDDPTELAQQLADLGGPDAVIRVDSFEGQQLPPKAQIKSVHVVRDQFAAEAPQPGTTFVDVITQPGVGPIRGLMNTTFRNDAMIARSPFVPTKGAEQMNAYNGNIGGSLLKGKTSFSASIRGQRQYTTPIVNAALPTGILAQTTTLRTPNDQLNASIVVDHALTRDQTLRVSYNADRIRIANLGVGNFSLPERAYTGHQYIHTVRLQEAGPLGRRAFMNTRLSVGRYELNFNSATEAPTIIVQDAFQTGGAQQTGGPVGIQTTLMSDVDYVRGINSWRTGVQIDLYRMHSDLNNNYLGTYTFASLDAYNAGQPLVYTRTVGDPHVRYGTFQGAAYVQDDIRLKGVTLSPGVRYSVEPAVQDRLAFEPRFGVTWSPSKNGKTTLRASAGIFHGFRQRYIIEQSTHFDGAHQQELVILNPSYPDPGPGGALAPSNRYLVGDNFHLQQNVRYSAGVDRILSPRVKFNVLYNYIHLQQQPRGENLNAPVNGVRPDPSYANVIASVTDAEIRRHEIYVNSTISLAAPSPNLNRDRLNWRRVQVQAGYTMIHARNNSDGPFTPPPSGTPATEWGPGGQDAPYRFNVMVTGTQLRNFTQVITWLSNSGYPYSLTTGFDGNHDGIINDRPPGVGLHTLRTPGQSRLNVRLQYGWVLGESPAAPNAQARYRLNLFTNVTNLLDHRNYAGYSGVLTSPFFERPTMVLDTRRVDVGMNISF